MRVEIYVGDRLWDIRNWECIRSVGHRVWMKNIFMKRDAPYHAALLKVVDVHWWENFTEIHLEPPTNHDAIRGSEEIKT
jgi:hypothetical protein